MRFGREAVKQGVNKAATTPKSTLLIAQLVTRGVGPSMQVD